MVSLYNPIIDVVLSYIKIIRTELQSKRLFKFIFKIRTKKIRTIFLHIQTLNSYYEINTVVSSNTQFSLCNPNNNAEAFFDIFLRFKYLF